jgi:glycosyltransferase involved in cell wall biosynthesis
VLIMKIAVYWESELWGGSDTHLLAILKNWPDQGDEFTVFFNHNNQGHRRIAQELEKLKYVKSIAFTPVFDIGVKCRDRNNLAVKVLKLLIYMGKPYIFWRMIRNCRKLFLRFGPFDGLLSNNGGYPAAWGSLAAIIAAKQINIPKRILHILHGATKPGIYSWEIFEHLVDRLICRSATDLVALSQATRKTLIDYRWFNIAINPIRVIYSGVDLSSSNENGIAPDADSLRKRFGLEDSLLVGMVGRLERSKGHEDLIIGFAFLPEYYRKKVKLVFIGSGNTDEIKRLKEMARLLHVDNSLVFTGYLQGTSQSFIFQLDLLAVMAKDFEGFGLTLAEAMSVGTPVMATSVGAIPEFVNNDIGFLISPESPYEVCQVLKKLIEDRTLFRQKAELAKEHIKAFTSDRLAKHFHVLFNLK